MKTYKKQVERPMLEIKHDMDAESPRNWSNLGYFITVDSKYNSPDRSMFLEAIVKNTGQVASSLDEHIKLIEKEANKVFENEKVIAIYPVCKYEHSGIVYSLGSKHGYDYSNNGFYIVTDKSRKELGTPKKSFEAVIKDELAIYTKWANGEVYGFVLYDADGEVEESVWGFYDIDEIKDALPKEWEAEDLSKYLTF